MLRTETTICDTRDLGIGWRVTAENWRPFGRLATKPTNVCVRRKPPMPGFSGCGHLHASDPTIADRRSIPPGLPFGDPRVMAVMAAVVGFPHNSVIHNIQTETCTTPDGVVVRFDRVTGEARTDRRGRCRRP